MGKAANSGGLTGKIVQRFVAAAILLLAVSTGVCAAYAPEQDVPGSQDSPLLRRTQDARIICYDQADDDEAVLPEARFVDFGFVRTRRLEGRITRIAYAFPRVLSTVEIMNHYEEELKGEGFKVVFACSGAQGCGGFSFGEQLTQPMVEAHAGDGGDRVIDFLHPVGNDIRYVLATLDRPQGRVTLALAVARHVNRPPGMFVETVEEKPAADPGPAKNATLIAAALRAQGRIALYDIHFAGGKATLRPDSRPVLEQVAALLRGTPGMKLLIVGHSDGSDTLAHGLDLSAAQARAVMQALVDRWKVPAAQVTSIGVGPASPLASDADEAGRAVNRRIELVLQ
jgi:OmpA-OmpF porin, OOP family